MAQEHEPLPACVTPDRAPPSVENVVGFGVPPSKPVVRQLFGSAEHEDDSQAAGEQAAEGGDDGWDSDNSDDNSDDSSDDSSNETATTVAYGESDDDLSDEDLCGENEDDLSDDEEDEEEEDVFVMQRVRARDQMENLNPAHNPHIFRNQPQPPPARNVQRAYDVM